MFYLLSFQVIAEVDCCLLTELSSRDLPSKTIIRFGKFSKENSMDRTTDIPCVREKTEINYTFSKAQTERLGKGSFSFFNGSPSRKPAGVEYTYPKKYLSFN